MCPCGKPLHYREPWIQAAIELLNVKLGPEMRVSFDGRTWLVPRHYVALHGVKAEDLIRLFREVD